MFWKYISLRFTACLCGDLKHTVSDNGIDVDPAPDWKVLGP